MTKEDIHVKQSVGDADYDIVMSACDKPVVLILLQHHFRPAEHESVYLQTSSKPISKYHPTLNRSSSE